MHEEKAANTSASLQVQQGPLHANLPEQPLIFSRCDWPAQEAGGAEDEKNEAQRA